VSVLQSSQYLGVPPSPATDPATVRILRTLPPQPITRLGEIVVSPTGTPTVQEIEERFRAIAAPWGAQAVVIVSDTSQPVGTVYSGDWWGGTTQSWWGRVIVGLAIRYQPVEPPR